MKKQALYMINYNKYYISSIKKGDRLILLGNFKCNNILII